jgi:hypothetical protein
VSFHVWAARRKDGIFFLWEVFAFLQGVLAKTGGRSWFFGGEFVVESW